MGVLGAAKVHKRDSRGVGGTRSELAVFALVVDAEDEPAASFYRHHGFVAFGSRPRHFVLPLEKLAKAAGSTPFSGIS